MHNPVNMPPYSHHGEYSPIVTMVNTAHRHATDIIRLPAHEDPEALLRLRKKLRPYQRQLQPHNNEYQPLRIQRDLAAHLAICIIRHRPWGDWRAKGSGMDSSSLACSGSGLDWLVALRDSEVAR